MTPNASAPADGGLWLTTTHFVTSASSTQKCGSYAFFYSAQAPAGWWRTDGTVGGTVTVAATTNPSTGYCLGATFLISEYDVRLRASTGGPATEIGDDGTKRSTTFSHEPHFVTAGTFAYFVTSTTAGPVSHTLYRTDGTSGGTSALLSNPSPTDHAFDVVTPMASGHLVTHTEDDALVVSDGTVAGTVTTSVSASLSRSQVTIGDRVYFLATDAAHGTERWVTDGTVVGTNVFDDVRPGSQSSTSSVAQRHDLYSADGQLFFVADDGTHGTQVMSATRSTCVVRTAGPG